MSNNVIHVDFAPRMCEAEAYIHQLARDLDPRDFMDFVDAVNNPECYSELDGELKEFVDHFYKCKRN